MAGLRPATRPAQRTWRNSGKSFELRSPNPTRLPTLTPILTAACRRPLWARGTDVFCLFPYFITNSRKNGLENGDGCGVHCGGKGGFWLYTWASLRTGPLLCLALWLFLCLRCLDFGWRDAMRSNDDDERMPWLGAERRILMVLRYDPIMIE